MNKEELLNSLEQLGFEMLRTQDVDVCEVLRALLSQDDSRLLESFPVVLANAFDKKQVSVQECWMRMLNSEQEDMFLRFSGVSLVLYEFSGYTSDWLEDFSKRVRPKVANLIDDYRKALNEGKLLDVMSCVLSAERLKKTFDLYLQREDEGLKNYQGQYDEFAFHQSMVVLFSPKQRELVLKKLKGRMLSKTEKEYYSRVVKKKLLAIANEQLFRTAQRLCR